DTTGISKACKGQLESYKEYKWKLIEPSKIHPLDVETQEWKIHPRFPKYKVSHDGRIYYIAKKRFIKPHINIDDYLTVSVKNVDGKRVQPRVHVLVAELYVVNPKPGEYTIVNHKDGNKQNPNADNLEWC